MFGSIRLLCAAENVTMNRLELGVLSFAVDHDTSRLAGRVTSLAIAGKVVYGSAEVSDSAYAQRILAEIKEGVRIGISPGFIIHEIEVEDKGSEADGFRASVEKWEPFEISSTAIPRNSSALVTTIQGGMSMQFHDITAPDLVTTSDLIGLSCQAARVAIRQRKGSEVQRARLGRMLRTFDASIAAGATRTQAAADARASLSSTG